MKVGHSLPCLVVLSLEVFLGDLYVDHGHSNVAVAEDLFEGWKAHTGAKHSCGKGVPQLVRPNGRTTCSFGRMLECLMYLPVIKGFSVRKQGQR
jgi:hypothetical protein